MSSWCIQPAKEDVPISQETQWVMPDDPKAIQIGLFAEAANFASVIEIPKERENIGFGIVGKSKDSGQTDPDIETRHFYFARDDLEAPLPELAKLARDEIHRAADGSLWEKLWWRLTPIVETQKDFALNRIVNGLFLRGTFIGRIIEKVDA